MPQGWLSSTYLMCLTDPVSGFPSQSCFSLFCLACCEQNNIQQESYSWDKGKQVEGLITCPQVLMVDVRGDDLMDCQSRTVNDWMSLERLIFWLLYCVYIDWKLHSPWLWSRENTSRLPQLASQPWNVISTPTISWQHIQEKKLTQSPLKRTGCHLHFF